MPPGEVHIERHHTCDILVIGAGVSGYCAAIQAGRMGCRTILIEKDAVLGGNAGPDVGVGITGADRYNPYGTETGIIHEIHEEAAWVRGFTQVSRGAMPYNISRRFEAVVQTKLEQAGVLVLKRHYARRPILLEWTHCQGHRRGSGLIPDRAHRYSSRGDRGFGRRRDRRVVRRRLRCGERGTA